MSKWILCGPLVGIILITVALIVGYIVVPPIVDRQIIENIQLIEGTDQYDRFVNIPQPLQFRVFIWNCTNVAEVQLGAIPNLVELGPWVYKQTRKKFNIRWSRDRERVSFYSQKTFHFDAELSYPRTEDDTFTVLNMPLNSILQIIDDMSRQMITNITRGVEKTIDHIPIINNLKRLLDKYTPLQSILQTVEGEMPLLLPIINTQINAIFGPTNSLFITTTPKQFFFGGVEFCKDPDGIAQIVCSSVDERNSPTIWKSDDGTSLLFAMFHHLNTTHDGLYEIDTGIRRIERVQHIQRWNNGRTLPFWKPDLHGSPSSCQQINGSDGTQLPPFRQKYGEFWAFASDICRSVHLQYDKPITYAGIDGFRYSPRGDFLNEMPECFCINKIRDALVQPNGCMYSGALDLTDCLDAPIVATLPHFYNAHRAYGLMVNGLDPDEEKHNIFTDIEPTTGTPLRAGQRMQFNMYLRRVSQITLTDHFVVPRLVPVLWVDEGIELNDDMIGMMNDELFNVLLLIDILQWTFVGIGAALVIGMLIWFFIALSRKKKNAKSLSVEPIYPTQ